MTKKVTKLPQLDDQVRAAKALLRSFRARNAHARNRVAQHLPQVQHLPREALREFPLTLTEAQTVIARERGLKSWGDLRLAIKLRAARFRRDARPIQAAGSRRRRGGTRCAAFDASRAARHAGRSPFRFRFNRADHRQAQSGAGRCACFRHGADINAKSQWWAGDFHILEVTPPDIAQRLGGARRAHHGPCRGRARLAGLAGARLRGRSRYREPSAAAMARHPCITPPIPP